MENFTTELLGNVLLSSYLAWLIWAVLGSVISTLLRNSIPNLKSYPINAVQILLGILITFAFIRFSLELTGLVPNAFGAFVVGLGGNELALAALKKFLNRKKENLNAIAEVPIDGGGDPNDPKKKP